MGVTRNATDLCGIATSVRGMHRAGTASMLATPVHSPPTTLARAADHPRFLEIAVGRLLELVVHSVEGARERLRGRVSVH